jgi:hypothetical protein
MIKRNRKIMRQVCRDCKQDITIFLLKSKYYIAGKNGKYEQTLPEL